jgi:3-oxoisoapionate decarboxylase
LELGISTWSVPWSVGVPGYPQPSPRLDVFGLVAKAAKQDVRVLQIADNLPLHELSSSELDRLREAAVAEDVTIEVGTRGVEPGHLTTYILVAERLGARALRTVLSGSMCDEAELAKTESAVRELLPELKKREITLAIENNEAFSAPEFSRLVQNISSPFVGICLDTANSVGRPEPLETVLAQLAPQTVMLHAKDYDIRRIDTRMGFSVIGRAAGEGRVDFDAVFGTLRERGRPDMSVIVEHWPPFEQTIEATVQLEEEWLAKSVNFLRGHLDK